MATITDEFGEVVEIPFPTGKFSEYLDLCEVTDFSQASFKLQQKIFLLIIADFRSGKNSLDDLSSMASEMLSYPESNDSSELSEFNDTLSDCSELNFYVRRIFELDAKNEGFGSMFISFMSSVMKYYYKYQHLIQNELDT